MCVSHNIRDMIKEMEHSEMRLKASISRTVTLSISSTSNATGESSSDPSESKKRRRSTPWIKLNKKVRDELDCIAARMFYTGGLLFNLIRNSWYVKAFKFAANNPIVG